MTPAAPISTRDTLQKYLSGANDADVIGSVFSWSISAGEVTFDDVKKWFVELGLDPQHMPAENKPVHAYRTATSDTTVDYLLPDGRRATLLFEETDSTGEKVYRKIVRRVRDATKHQLEYDPNLGRADFYFAANAVKFSMNKDRLYAGEEAHVQELIDTANQRFHFRKDHLNHAKLARIVRDYLKAMNAVALRPSGGIYFIHKSRQRTVESLHMLIERFGEGSTVVLVPLPDTTYSRDKILERLDEDLSSELSSLVDEISEVQSSPNKRKLAALHDRIVSITDRMSEHNRILGTQEMQSKTLLAAATQALMQAQSRPAA